MENRAEKTGNSRAAQKKRKLLEKRRNVNTSQLNVPTSDSPVIQSKKTRPCDDKFSSLFDHTLSTGKLSVNLEDFSIANLLKLEDTIDMTVVDIAAAIVSKLVAPMNLREFFNSKWKKLPTVISNSDSPLARIFSLKSLKSILLKQILTRNIDIHVMSNESNNDETLNGSAIWKDLTKGKYGIQLIQPQKFNDLLWKLLSTLEVHFGTRVACTAIFFPKLVTEALYQKSDMNCFFIQQEGSSEWNLERCDGDGGMKCDDNRTYSLSQGDVLYVPQGWKSEMNSKTTDDCLIVDLSIEETQTKDLLQLLLPQAVEAASICSCYLKKPLPTNIRTYMGVAGCESGEEASRELFSDFIKAAINDVAKHSLEILDPAIDQVNRFYDILSVD